MVPCLSMALFVYTAQVGINLHECNIMWDNELLYKFTSCIARVFWRSRQVVRIIFQVLYAGEVPLAEPVLDE